MAARSIEGDSDAVTRTVQNVYADDRETHWTVARLSLRSLSTDMQDPGWSPGPFEGPQLQVRRTACSSNIGYNGLPIRLQPVLE